MRRTGACHVYEWAVLITFSKYILLIYFYCMDGSENPCPQLHPEALPPVKCVSKCKGLINLGFMVFSWKTIALVEVPVSVMPLQGMVNAK